MAGRHGRIVLLTQPFPAPTPKRRILRINGCFYGRICRRAKPSSVMRRLTAWSNRACGFPTGSGGLKEFCRATRWNDCAWPAFIMWCLRIICLPRQMKPFSNGLPAATEWSSSNGILSRILTIRRNIFTLSAWKIPKRDAIPSINCPNNILGLTGNIK